MSRDVMLPTKVNQVELECFRRINSQQPESVLLPMKNYNRTVILLQIP